MKDTFHQAEVARIFECKQMNGLVKRSVEAVFVQDSFSTLEDYFYLHQMLMSASDYGEIEHVVSAERTLIAKAKSSWLPKLMDFDLST